MIHEKKFLTNADRLNAVIEAYVAGNDETEVASRYSVKVNTLRDWSRKFASHEWEIPENPVRISNAKLTIYNEEDQFLTFPLSLIPVLISLIYIFGYFLIAINLSKYNVSPIYLFDAQYFAAGLLPSLAFLIVYLTIYYVWAPEKFNLHFLGKFGEKCSTSIKKCLRKHHVLILIIFISIIVIDDILLSINLISDTVVTEKVLYSIFLVFSVLNSIFALGILVYKIREWVSKFNSLESKEETNTDETNLIKYFLKIYPKIFLLCLVLIYGIYSIWIVGFSVMTIYQNLPQSLGGGKLTQIELVLDTDKISDDLERDLVKYPSGRTKPLCLVYHSQDSYIVIDECNDGSHDLWVLSSNIVLGEVTNTGLGIPSGDINK